MSWTYIESYLSLKFMKKEALISLIFCKTFKIGKAQGYEILKNKDLIKLRCQQSENSSFIHRPSNLLYSDINNSVFKWFCYRWELKLTISGPLIQEQALLIAKALKTEKFKASIRLRKEILSKQMLLMVNQEL